MLYLWSSWSYRREEVLGAFTDDAIADYFKMFLKGRDPHYKDNLRRSLEYEYDKRFGRRRYILPVLLLAVIAGLAIFGVVWTILARLDLRTHGVVLTPVLVAVPRMAHVWIATGFQKSVEIPLVAVGALSGAYVWVLSDALARWRRRDMRPVDSWWHSLRFVMAIPLGYSFAAMANPDFGFAAAFFLGMFPTKTLFTVSRRFASRQLSLGAEDDHAESQLQKLEGVDNPVAQRLADEGITTIAQLAWFDPVDLIMRCPSYSFSYVIDLVSQALAWMYFEDKLTVLTPFGIRGAQEVAVLMDELDGVYEEDSPKAAALAKNAIALSAAKLEMDPDVVKRTLREIAEDPFTRFIGKIWHADEEEEEEE